jgi:hypothetical protein
MTRTSVAVATILLLSYPASAQELQKLIEQNVKASAGRLANEAGTRPPDLWIHVRSDTQRLEVQGKLAWFKAIQVNGRKLDVRPIQQVATGPQQSQLRFFKATDRTVGQMLLAQVSRAIPAVVLQDMSNEYRGASWIDSGHFELWLAPGVTRIATP